MPHKINELLRSMASESTKLRKLRPPRYVLATSVDLSPGNKDDLVSLPGHSLDRQQLPCVARHRQDRGPEISGIPPDRPCGYQMQASGRYRGCVVNPVSGAPVM